jgi:hypothetical protein
LKFLSLNPTPPPLRLRGGQEGLPPIGGERGGEGIKSVRRKLSDLLEKNLFVSFVVIRIIRILFKEKKRWL